MITKKLNFTVVTGKIIEKIRSPDPAAEPFSPDYEITSFIFTIPRKLSYESAVREVRKRFSVSAIVKDSVYVDYEQHCYTISIEDFIKAASLVK